MNLKTNSAFLLVVVCICAASQASASSLSNTATLQLEELRHSDSRVTSLIGISTRQNRCTTRQFNQLNGCLCWAIFKKLVIPAGDVGNKRQFAKACAQGLGKTYVGQLKPFCRPFRTNMKLSCKTTARKLNRRAKKCLGSLGNLKPAC